MTDDVRRERGGSHKCRHAFCPNNYTDVIGGDNAFGKHKAGAVCIPCLYAEQMVDQGQTIEQIQAAPQIMEMFLAMLHKSGWTWQDMKDSYQRMQLASMKSGTARGVT